ncbi:Uncharacterised protein [Candidatus Venteria ishoeyi]|uniref:Uncharacterized protein n=1 Tax=Candidatus Venteria ishoeyi TaxID=1899563 RepID=A0A1H6FCR4_9GAMM|nr:Uncharacterised protein [Candidatus Venteria ishoeyi]
MQNNITVSLPHSLRDMERRSRGRVVRDKPSFWMAMGEGRNPVAAQCEGDLEDTGRVGDQDSVSRQLRSSKDKDVREHLSNVRDSDQMSSLRIQFLEAPASTSHNIFTSPLCCSQPLPVSTPPKPSASDWYPAALSP